MFALQFILVPHIETFQESQKSLLVLKQYILVFRFGSVALYFINILSSIEILRVDFHGNLAQC
jgi:AAA+ ATPase superfamily predicted ATPase